MVELMSDCLCCAHQIPVTSQKICPLCSHLFKGQGWWGIDAHWKSQHEKGMPYQTFWAGLCDNHRNTEMDGSTHSGMLIRPMEAVDENYTQALAQRSSHVENILTHALITSIAQELWQRDPWLDLQVFKAEVDDSGFDLVFGCNGAMRYIQIKQTHLRGNAVKYSLRLDFSKMVGGCAVVIVYNAKTLVIDHCLFFGSTPRQAMPPVEHLPMSQSPGRRTADGVRMIRENYRDVPRRSFKGPLNIPQIVDLLFPIAGDTTM